MSNANLSPGGTYTLEPEETDNTHSHVSYAICLKVLSTRGKAEQQQQQQQTELKGHKFLNESNWESNIYSKP